MECPSCGATGQEKAHCEACGFAFPQASTGDADDALSLFLGLVCVSCDTYNDPGTNTCVSCGAHLEAGEELEPSGPVPVAPAPSTTPSSPSSASSASSTSPAAGTPAVAPPSWMTPPTGQTISTQFKLTPMGGVWAAAVDGGGRGAGADVGASASGALIPAPAAAMLARSTLGIANCWRCQAPLELKDKFCRNCGARIDAAEAPADPLRGLPKAPPVGAAGVATTQMIGALNLPSPSAQVGGAASSTMVIPAMKIAQAGGGAAPSGGASGGPTATMVFGAATVERVAKLILVRGHNQFGNQWRLQAGETIIGRNDGMVLFPDDDAMANRHARLVWRGEALYLEPEPTTNGVFVRLRAPVQLKAGDEFLVGAQRLRVLAQADRPVAVQVAQDGTRLLGSMVKAQAPIMLARVAVDDRDVEVYHRAQRLLTVGRNHCDITFPSDGFVSERHAQLTQEADHLLLEDLGSRNGTYVRAHPGTRLFHGDLLVVGDQVLRIELPRGS